MSATANLVHANFVWRISAIDPTSTACGKDRFFPIDPRASRGTDPRTSSGLMRGFAVTWRSAGELNQVGGMGISDTGPHRVSEHVFDVDVYYSTKLSWVDVQQLMLSDRHDIIASLRQPSTWVGYDSSHTTTALGLANRFLESEESTVEEDTIAMRQTWRCVIEETE